MLSIAVLWVQLRTALLLCGCSSPMWYGMPFEGGALHREHYGRHALPRSCHAVCPPLGKGVPCINGL
jgi:hypothetical protein